MKNKIYRMKTKYLIIFSLIFILLIPSLVMADKGMVIVGPERVSLQESGQNAIVAWNGNEEVIILSTNAKSSESTLVLEVLPLPSNPSKVEQGSFDSFKKLTKIINKKVRAIREQLMYRKYGLEGLFVRPAGGRAPGVRITFHKKIGAHDVTVVKVSDLDYFINWIKNFTASKGFEYRKISPKFKNSVRNYLERDIKFFVFDVIEASKNKQSIKPLIYRFKTDFLYYPLEITATSDAGRSASRVNIFLIAKGIVNKALVWNINLRPETGFDYNIELSEKELKEVSPEIADLFGLFSSAYGMNAYYSGYLVELNKDLVVYQHDIHIPTFSEKISHWISTSLAFTYISDIWEGLIEATIAGKAIAAIILLSFIIGIPAVIFILTNLIKKLLKKCNLESFGYSLFACAIAIIITALLLSNISLFITFISLAIFTLIGFSMMIFLMVKFFQKYVF